MELEQNPRPFEVVGRLSDESRARAGRGKGGRMALAGMSLLALAAVIGVLLVGGEGWNGGRVDLAQGSGDYCDGFADPSACRAFREKAKHKYWSESRVRNELFKVMKGVAMMDEKMEAKNTAHSKALDTQKQMFTSFRSSMIKEMDSLHKLQAKVGEAHTKAFKQLSSQLEEAKQQLADYTQQQLQAQGGSVEAFDAKQKANTERIIQTMKDRVADLTKKLSDLREQTNEELDAQRQLAKTVESGLVKSDQDMLDELTQLHRESNRLDRQQQEHAEELRAKLASQAQTESSDVADSKTQADEGMTSVAGVVQQGLDASRAFINQAVQQGLASLAAGVASEQAVENSQWNALSKEVASVNASETAEDTARAAEISKLRGDFELISAQLTAQISQIASRANTSSIQLADDRSQLVDASEASSAFLTGRMGSGMRSLENKTDTVTEAQKARLASIELALANVADGIKNFGDAEDSAQMQWNAQKYNFEGEVHRTTQGAEKSLEEDVASQLGIEQADIDTLMKHSQEELALVESSTEKASIAMNKTIEDALWGLEQNVSLREQQLVAVLGQYSELNASQLSTLGVSKEDAEGLVGMIDEMQETLARLMSEDRSIVEGRTKDVIADVDFNASQTLQRYKSEIRAKIADGLRDLTTETDAVQRRSVEKNDAFSEDFEAEQKQQSVINNKQLDLISKMARVAKRHATAHTLDISLAESELNSLHLDLKEFKDFIQKTHAKDMKHLTATAHKAVAQATEFLSTDVDNHGQSLNRDVASEAAKVDATISALRADVAGSARDLATALQRANGVANRDHQGLLANLTSLSAGLNGYQRTLRSGIKALTARLKGLDLEMSRARSRVGGVQRMSHQALTDEVKDEVDGLAERLRSAIAGDREALLSLSEGGFSSLKTAVANERDAIQQRMGEISEEQRDVARQSREDHAVHMDAVQELNWNQGNVTERFDEYMDRIEARLQRVSDRIERGLGSDGENQRFGAWQEKVSRETKSMELQYSSMLKSEEDDVQRLLQATRTSLLARVTSLNESMRMSHAEVNASTQDLHLSDTSQHEAAMQRVDQASKYLADYSDNIDGLVDKQAADLKALGENQRATALKIEAQRAADYEALLSKLDAGITHVRSVVESQLHGQVEAAHGEVDHDYESGTTGMEAYANASEASADAIQDDLDKLEDSHGAHVQSAEEELHVLKDAESEAELWSEQNHTEMGSQLADLKEELEMTLASLTSVQNLQFKLIASSIASSRASRSAKVKKLRDDLMSRVKVVSSSVATAKAQLAAVHTLLGKEEQQDRADVAHVLKSELASLQANMTAELKDGSDTLRSELRARMSQLHSLVASARTREEEAVKDMGRSVTDDNRARTKASLAFDRKVAAIESGLDDARADEIKNDKELGSRLDKSVTKLNTMLAAASKDKHTLYHELEGKVTSSVVSAAGSLWDMLQKTVKGVDDEISSQLGIMGDRLPKDREDFRKQLNAVRNALTTAGQAQQQHAVEQMKALHALSLTIDKLETSTSESIPKEKQRASKLLADLRALDAERVAKHEEVSGSIREMVRTQLRDISGRVGKDMMSSLEGMHSAIARNATALDQRMAAASEAAQKERDATLEQLKKFQAGLQASALQQAAAANQVHSALLQAESVLRTQAEKLDRKFIGLSDVTQQGRSDSRKSLEDIKTSLHQLEAIVEQGEMLQKRYRKLGAAVEDSRTELKSGFRRAKARTEELAKQLVKLQRQAEYGFGNVSTRIEGVRHERSNVTAVMSGKLDELRSQLHEQQKALDELVKESGPKGPQGPVGAEGPLGPRGARGPKGPPGDRGMEGKTGAQGRIGKRGKRGPAGDKGGVGPQGKTGKRGAVGKRGIAGVVGEKGATGKAGKRGKRGTRGAHGKHGRGYGKAGLRKLRHLAHGVVKKLKADKAAVLLPKVGDREVARLKDRRGRYLGKAFAKRLLRTAGWKISKTLVRRGGHWRGLHARIVRRIGSKAKSLREALGPRLLRRLQKRQSRVVGRRLVRDLVNMVGRKKAKKLLRRGWNWRFLAKRYVKVVTPNKEKKLTVQIGAPVVAELKKRQGKRLGRNLARRLQTMMTRHESKRLVQRGGRWRHLNRWVVRRLVVGSKRVKRLEASLGKPVVAKLMKRQDKVLGTHLARLIVRTIGRQSTKRLLRRGHNWRWLNRRIVRLNVQSRRVKQLQGRMGAGLWSQLQKRRGKRLGKSLAKRLTFKLGRRNVIRLTRQRRRRRRSSGGRRRTWKWLSHRIVKKVHRRHEKSLIKVLGRRNVNKLKDKRGDSLGVYAKYLIGKLGWRKASRLVRRGRHWRGLHSRIVKRISNRRATKLRVSIGQKLLSRLQRRQGLQLGRYLAKRIVNIIGRQSTARLVRRGWNWRYIAYRFVRRMGSKRQKLLAISLGQQTVNKIKKLRGKRLGKPLARFIVRKIGRRRALRLVRRGGTWRHLNVWIVRKIRRGSHRAKRLEATIGRKRLRELMARQNKRLGASLAIRLVRSLGRQPVKLLLRRPSNWRYLNRRKVRRLNARSRRVKRLRRRMGGNLWARLSRRQGKALGKALAKRLVRRLGRYSTKKLLVRRNRPRRSRRSRRRRRGGRGGRRGKGRGKWNRRIRLLARRIVKKVSRKKARKLAGRIGSSNVSMLRRRRGQHLGKKLTIVLVKKLGWKKTKALVWRGGMWRRLAVGIVKRVPRRKAGKLRKLLGNREFRRLQRRNGSKMGRKFAKRVERMVGWGVARTLVRRGGHWRGLPRRIVRKIRKKRSKRLRVLVGKRYLQQLKRRRGRVLGHYLARAVVRKIGRSKTARLVRRGWNWRWLAKRRVRRFRMKKEKRLMPSIGKRLLRRLKRRRAHRLGRRLGRRLTRMLGRNTVRRIVRKGGNWRGLQRRIVRRLSATSRKMRRLRATVDKKMLDSFLARVGKRLGSRLAKSMVQVIGRKMLKTLLHWVPRRGPGWCSMWYWNPLGRRQIRHMPKVAHLFPQVAKVFKQVDFRRDSAFQTVVGTRHFDRVAITFRGRLRIRRAGKYRICTNSDDGSHVSVDGKPFVSSPGLHPPRKKCRTAKLSRGDHPVFMRFFENGGGAYMRATYSGPDTNGIERNMKSSGYPGTCDAPKAKCKCGKGWCSEFFFDPNGQGQVRNFVDISKLNGQAAKTLSKINFRNDNALQRFLGSSSKKHGFDHVAVRFNGVLRIKKGGRYKVCTSSDDGSRLLINKKVAVDNGGLHGTRKRCNNVQLTSGDHFTVVDFFENGGGASIKVMYSGPDTSGKEKLMPSVWHNPHKCGPVPP